MFVEVVGGFPFGNIFKADSTTIQIWDFIVLYNDICLKGFFILLFWLWNEHNLFPKQKMWSEEKKKELLSK